MHTGRCGELTPVLLSLGPLEIRRTARVKSQLEIETQGGYLYPIMKDYYLDKNKKVVFTKEYHLKRGHCCNNKCLHCPYKKKSKKDTNLKK